MRIKEIPIPHINLYLPQDEINESAQRLYRDSVLPTAYINREKIESIKRNKDTKQPIHTGTLIKL